MQDVRAALLWLSQRPGVRPDALGLAGASMGASLAVLAALDQPLARVVATVSLTLDYQGLRVSEVARMHGNLIDPDARTLRVRGKGGHELVMPAHPRVLALARRMPTGYWFPSQRGRHLGGRTVSQRIRLHMIRNRVQGTAHSLRHFFCTTLVEHGADLRVVQELARHSQLSTTAVYVAASDTRQRAALESIGGGG